jgi:hypothetical protein
VSEKLPKNLSEKVFEIVDADQVDDLLAAVAKAVGGVSWLPIGGIENNVHTVEVASDPALALTERPINGIDAILDLAARERGTTAPTPHAAAQEWYGVPDAGFGAMSDTDRRKLAEMLQVTMLESDDGQRPTIMIQDGGTGQHPDDFPATLLSLLASNKKGVSHVMGVYNAGGAASYRFANYTIIVSRLAPSLLDGQTDEVGFSIVRYNPLDPDQYKTGTYEYLAAKDGSILRLSLPQLPEMPHGTYVKLIEYELSRYARAAHEPKQSLWHLFHAALPDPPLPLQIIERRDERFKSVRGVERRTVSGLLYLLGRKGTADYSDEREIDLGTLGKVTLRYYVLNEGRDPDAYTTSKQGLTITLNGQRQITRDRAWVKRQLDLPFLYKRMVVTVDGTGLSNKAKRAVFSSTRETGVDSPEAQSIIDRVVDELDQDENLSELDEQAKQRVLEDAQKTTTTKVKKQLAKDIGAFLKGELTGGKGGRKHKKRRRRKRRKGVAPTVDDSAMLKVPDTLQILNDPVRIDAGATGSVRLEINAKNGFLPDHADGLSVVIGSELADHVSTVSKGRLLGGRVRVTLQAAADAPITSSTMQVALVVPELGVLLTADGTIEVAKAKDEDEKDSRSGGEPNIDISWVGKDKWTSFDPEWDAQTVGVCNVSRDDPSNATAITKVEWFMNEDFASYSQVIDEKNLGETALTRFRESYEYPVLLGLFKQRLAEEAKELEADAEGQAIDIPDDYVRGEQARMARAVLMAMEPDIQVAEAVEADPVTAGV